MAPIDYGPILLLKPFGFRIAPDTLSSNGFRRWLARHYPRLWIRRSSFERRRDFNPPDSCAAQRTLRPLLTSASRSRHLATPSPDRTRCRSPGLSLTTFVTHPPDLQHRPLMDRTLRLPALVQPALPPIRFLFVEPRLCSTLPSDDPSRRRPCASLVLHLHQVRWGTCPPKLSDMSDTQACPSGRRSAH